MNWRRIPKEQTPKPVHGTVYSDWKVELSIEGAHQCVYCSISEVSFGGIRNFHVEHYKPKSLKQFAALTNEFSNLYYACAICNTFKGNDWPGDPIEDCSIECFPDPSLKNYGEIFTVNHETAVIKGCNVSGVYIANKLYLNRPQLLLNRKEHILEKKYQTTINEVHILKDELFALLRDGNSEILDYLVQLDIAVRDLESIFHAKETSIPYTQDQTKRSRS